VNQLKVALGCDHAGYLLKESVRASLESSGHEVIDKGTFSQASCDYPDFAEQVAAAVAGGGAERGICICATGIGMAMAANKVAGIRAAVCNDLYSARFSRLHNDANLLALGARIIGPGLAEEIVKVWMETDFEAGRHSRRVDKIAGIEERDGGRS
jgi:ribose 5-phosphate isomerase B